MTLKTAIAIAIAALVIALVAVKKRQAIRLAREDALTEELRAVRRSITLYYVFNKDYPKSLNVLPVEKYTMGEKLQPYLTGVKADKENFPMDSFGKRFNYDPAIGRVWASGDKYADW